MHDTTANVKNNEPVSVSMKVKKGKPHINVVRQITLGNFTLVVFNECLPG